jgi:hypothetical protein
MDSTDVPPAFGMCTKIGNSSPSFFDCKFKSYLYVSLAYVSGGYAPKRARESDSEDDDDDAPKLPAIANVKPTAETTATMPLAAVFKFKEDDDVLVLLFVAFSSASSNGARS